MFTKIKHKILLLSALLLTVIALKSCVMENDEVIDTFDRPDVKIDLPEILHKGKITILAENSTTSYFYYKGKEMGFEYEILKLFAEEIGVELEVKVVN